MNAHTPIPCRLPTPEADPVEEAWEDQGVAAEAAALAPSGLSPSGSQGIRPPAANADPLSDFIFEWFNDRDPDEMARCLAAHSEQR